MIRFKLNNSNREFVKFSEYWLFSIFYNIIWRYNGTVNIVWCTALIRRSFSVKSTKWRIGILMILMVLTTYIVSDGISSEFSRLHDKTDLHDHTVNDMGGSYIYILYTQLFKKKILLSMWQILFPPAKKSVTSESLP